MNSTEEAEEKKNDEEIPDLQVSREGRGENGETAIVGDETAIESDSASKSGPATPTPPVTITDENQTAEGSSDSKVTDVGDTNETAFKQTIDQSEIIVGRSIAAAKTISDEKKTAMESPDHSLVSHVGEIDETTFTQKTVRSDSSTSSSISTPSTRVVNKRKITKPVEFKFHKSKNNSCDQSDGSSASKDKSYVPLAKSVDVLRSGLRDDSRGESPGRKSKPSLTKPHAPKFHQAHTRELPKSTEEKEKEIMEELKSKPFKANPVPAFSREELSAETKKKTKKTTEPQPFHFASDERAASHAKSIESLSVKQEIEECKKKFKARPAPVFSQKPTVDAEDKKPKHVTEPQPFQFASDERAASHPKPVENPSEKEEIEECKKKFKALPMPDFSHQPTVVVQEKRSKNVDPQPFHFRIDERMKSPSASTSSEGPEETPSTQFKARPVPKTTYTPSQPVHHKVKPASSPSSHAPRSPIRVSEPRTTNEQTPKSERQMIVSKQQEGEQPMEAKKKGPEVNSTSQKEKKPFNLKSVARHEECQKQLAEQRKREEEEQRRQAEFHARPFVKPHSSPSNSKAIRSVTHPQPFPLEGVARHQDFEGERIMKLSMEEEERKKRATFKARPLPKTTQTMASPRRSGKKAAKDQAATHSDAGSSLNQPQLPSNSNAEENERRGSRTQNSKYGTPDSQSQSCWLAVYGFVCFFRILNVFLVQSYFDPDEFWQTLEPAYCKVFAKEEPCPGLTWEWTRRAPESASDLIEQSMLGPVRSYLSVLPTYALYWTAKRLKIDSYWLVSRGPMMLNALIVAAPIDVAVWYIARWLETSNRRFLPVWENASRVLPAWCLFCSLISWFNAFSLVRTFANCQEAELLILAIALVSPELVGNVNARFGFVRSCLAFLLGGMSVAIRFTSLAAFVPMGLLLARQHHLIWLRLGYLILPCAVFGMMGLAIALTVDRQFFGFWTLPFLGNFHFNVVLDLADLYGSHPWHWYFTSGLPTISGLLLPFLSMDFGRLMFSKVSYGQRNLWLIVLSYVLTMSLNDHKEFRFILPVLPLLCLLAGSSVRAFFVGNKGRRSLPRLFVFGFTFVVANLVAVFYLGMFHQTGPIKVNRKIVESARKIAELQSSSEAMHFSIHYLTGSCHSTPLHSHLHAPPLNFDTWSLDCSPDCRSDPEQICEEERFVRDPDGFVEEAYIGCVNAADENSEPCSDDSRIRQAPDFLVTLSSYADAIRPKLEVIGLNEIARYPHHINGARLFDIVFGDDFDEISYRHLTVLGDLLEVSVEDMIVFSQYQVDLIPAGSTFPTLPRHPAFLVKSLFFNDAEKRFAHEPAFEQNPTLSSRRIDEESEKDIPWSVDDRVNQAVSESHVQGNEDTNQEGYHEPLAENTGKASEEATDGEHKGLNEGSNEGENEEDALEGTNNEEPNEQDYKSIHERADGEL